MGISVIKLKLPSVLKAQLDRLARRSGETSNALMIRVIFEHVAAARSYRNFLHEARRADAAMQKSGIGYAMKDVHEYISAKARGEKARRPRPLAREAGYRD